MERNTTILLFTLLMIAIIVAVDILLFRNHFWARLASNVGIVLIFVALYLRFLH